MKINYILSDTTNYATTKALQEVATRAKENLLSNFIVIVPETKSIAIEKELLSLTESEAVFNVGVYSFVRLLSRIGGIDQSKVISKQVCVMMLRKIISENADKFVCYKKNIKSVGFAEKMYDTIQQFKSSEVSPDDLLEVVKTGSNTLKLKLQDIILLFEAYEEAIATKFFDDCDKLRLLVNLAKSSETIKNSEIFVVGFDNITTEMQSVLQELACNAKEITFSCCYFHEKREDKYIQKNELYNKFKHIADKLKQPYVPKVFESVKSGDFYHVKNSLFAPQKKEQKYAGDIKIFEAKSKFQELEFVACKIIESAKKGKRYKDICVLAPSLEQDISIVEQVFKLWNIPYFVKKSYEISNHPLVELIKQVFAVESSHFSSEKVLELLSNPYVDAQNVPEFENYVRATGLSYGALVRCECDDEKLKPTFEFLRAFTEKMHNHYKECATVSDFVAFVKSIRAEFEKDEKTNNLASVLSENGFAESSEVFKRVPKKIDELTLTLDNFMGQTSVTAEEFLQIFLSGLSTMKLNLTPMSVDSVLIQDNIDGFFDKDIMFVVGAIEGAFPKKMIDSGVILDTELEQAKNLIHKPIEPTIKQINARENYAVYEAMLLPKEKFYISYSEKSFDGKENKPSSIIVNLSNMFGKAVFVSDFKPYIFDCKKVCENKFALHLNDYIKGGYRLSALCEEYSSVADILSKNLIEAIERYNLADNDFELKNADELYFAGNKTSISQLEKYFACPYKFFIHYGLRLKENKDAKLDAIDIGSIIHRVAELFVKNIEKMQGLDEINLDREILKIVSFAVSEIGINEEKNQVVLKFLSEESIRLCKYILFEQNMSSFKNVQKFNEYKFAGKNAVEIEAENKKLTLEGKIDRTDEWGNYKRIIDYKTGDISSDLTSVYYGKKIQLVSYLLASDKISDKKIAGLFYFPIHSDYVKNSKKVDNLYKMQGFLIDDAEVLKHMDNSVSFESPNSALIPLKIKTSKDNIAKNVFEVSRLGVNNKYFSEGEFEELKAYAKELLSGACSEILSGYIEPSPLSIKSDSPFLECTRCEFAGFCGLKKSKFADGRNCTQEVSKASFKQLQKEVDNG